jgi:hypothetical protein
MTTVYEAFLERRRKLKTGSGFTPIWIPDFLFDFQKTMTEWAIVNGRSALFEDCGLGKTIQQLVWAENVVRHTNKPVLLATPLAVGAQTVAEAAKFGIDAERSRDGKFSGKPNIVVTNYEQLAKYSPNDFGGRTKYRFRGHAEEPFWQWVCSWSRSLRKPSDAGGCDDGFILPPLRQREIVVETKKAREGMLFAMAATNLQEQREERRNSIVERCVKAAEVIDSHDGPSVMWCELNDEGNMLTEVIPNAVQIKGAMPDHKKEELLTAFTNGEIETLVTKPKIGAWGLNWQHCANVVSFPSHSFEQMYQSVRRCWRFGQKSPVDFTLIVNEGEVGVLESLKRKQAQCEQMFESIVRHMSDAQALTSDDSFSDPEEVPSWL